MHNPITQARIDLTAALRSAVRLGFHEGVCNHFSLAIPGESNRFFINPQGLHWSELTPLDLVIVDSKGQLIEGYHTVEPSAFFIHSQIHRAKKNAACILHTHMPYATALTLVEGGRLKWVSQNSLHFYNRVAYDEEYNGLVLDDAEGQRLCTKLRSADVLFLANHGVIICGESVAAAFDDLYYLERACMVQVLAESMGQPLKCITEEIAEKTARQIAGESQQVTLHFEALKRLLDRDEPGWSKFD